MTTLSVYMSTMDYIATNPGCSVSEIATALGLEYSVVKEVVDAEYTNLRLTKSPKGDHSVNRDVWGYYILGM